MDNSAVWFALGLTVFAGLSTGIGSIMSFFSKRFNPRFLAGALGFSAGVMIYVSLVEIFFKARVALSNVHGQRGGYWLTILAFFTGIGIIALIDKIIPNIENPHEVSNIREFRRRAGNEAETVAGEDRNGKVAVSGNGDDRKLMRMGMFSALAIAIHNFPEGLATFMGALTDPALGVSIAVAIAIHNIPEGVAVSAPIYYATKSRRKAFWYSFLSGFSEPVGALIGYFLLRRVFNEVTFGLIFAGVAGIMVYISLDELLPTAEEYGEHHVAIAGLIAGMAVMALSLVLFV